MIAPILTFLNGKFAPELSDDLSLLNEITYDFSDGFSLRLKQQKQFSLHIKLMGDKPYSFNKKIILENNATCHLIEECLNKAIDVKTELQLDDSARMHYYKLQNKQIQQDQIIILQKQASYLQLFFSDNDIEKTIRTIHVKLLEPHAECSLRGLYSLLNDSSHVTNQILVEHIAEKGVSSMLFKGVLDKKSTASFIGRVHVHPNAQHTQAKQENHNLLLSNDAKVQTKPELEIYADDVKCSHGATVGQLDDEALFYLQSRCIEKSQAHQLLVQAFVMDLLHTIQDTGIKQYIEQRVPQYAEC